MIFIDGMRHRLESQAKEEARIRAVLNELHELHKSGRQSINSLESSQTARDLVVQALGELRITREAITRDVKKGLK
jgi:hypothetical protein